MIDAQAISETLGGKRTGKDFIACCPAHDDRKPSLSIADGDNGKPVVFCNAGCSQDAVIQALSNRGLWPENGNATLTLAELERNKAEAGRRRQEREAKEQQAQEAAAAKARERWDTAQPAGEDHPYLVKKQIPAHGAKQDSDKLLIPMRDESGKLWSLQTIDPDGRKLFHLSGCRTKGLYSSIGGKPEPGVPVCIAEGFATAAAIHESTGYPVAVAFSAHNMEAVAITIKNKLPGHPLILCADDDRKEDSGNNPGIETATRAALAVGGLLVFPDMGRKADFWDLWHEQGADAVKGRMEAATAPGGRQVTEITEAVAVDDEHLAGISLRDEDGKKKPVVTILIEIGKKHELFHDHQRAGYSTVNMGDHSETWSLESGFYQAYLSDQYFKLTQRGCSRPNIKDAVDTLQGTARNNGFRHRVHRRVAGIGGKIFIDLGAPDWRVIEVAADGWRVLNNSPVKFIRSESTAAFPEPTINGDINRLWRFLNVKAEDRPLILGYLIRALNPSSPYFAVAVTGEQGTGKSTFSRIARNCTDPSTSALRPPPRDDREFLAGAVNNWNLCYDNLSGMQTWLSDSLCRVLTGGSFASRTLYTTNDETTIPLARPVILNGIDDITERGDLADRCIVLNLQPISESGRVDERALWREWDAEFPGIFGALLDGLSSAIRNVDKVILPFKPRMADAAIWATAAEEGLHLPEGAFMEAYTRNIEDAVEVSLNASPFAKAVLEFIQTCKIWEGTPTELLSTVSRGMSDDVLRSKAWPKSSEWASKYCRRFAPALRKIGISFDDDRDAGQRIIRMSVSSTPEIKNKLSENTVITVIPSQIDMENDSNDSNDGRFEKFKIYQPAQTPEIVEVEI